MSLNRDNLIRVFEQTGLIVFRDFDLKPNNVMDFTDMYTKNYASDAPRRK